VYADILTGSRILILLGMVAYAGVVFYHARPIIKPRAAPFPLYLSERIVVFSAALFLLAFLVGPESFMEMPRERTQLWLLIVILYPFISALPQEFLYRHFYFWRYQDLFPNKWVLLISSVLVYSFVHIIFDNWIAIALTLVGGLLFATTYMYTRRLSLAWIEHAIYGQVVFTAGLGPYFYEAPW
jgi:membrane protease YdiL (CAAX protease family)